VNRTLAAKIYVLARPVLVSQLAVMAYAVIDTIMAGRHGTDDLAAVGIEASIYFSLFVGLTGVLLAVTPTIAHLYGARRDAEIGEQVRQAMWLAAFLAAISIAAFSHPEPFLRLSKPPPIRSSSTSPRSRSWRCSSRGSGRSRRPRIRSRPTSRPSCTCCRSRPERRWACSSRTHSARRISHWRAPRASRVSCWHWP
jgi:hypothetical protein